MTAAGTSKNEDLVMTCPAGSVINQYQAFTQIVDSGGTTKVNDITAYVNAANTTTFSESTAKILKAAGIDPYVPYNKKKGLYPTRVVYASWACGQPIPTTTTTASSVGTSNPTDSAHSSYHSRYSHYTPVY
jgi:hypothetical protein